MDPGELRRRSLEGGLREQIFIRGFSPPEIFNQGHKEQCHLSRLVKNPPVSFHACWKTPLVEC